MRKRGGIKKEWAKVGGQQNNQPLFDTKKWAIAKNKVGRKSRLAVLRKYQEKYKFS